MNYFDNNWDNFSYNPRFYNRHLRYKTYGGCRSCRSYRNHGVFEYSRLSGCSKCSPFVVIPSSGTGVVGGCSSCARN